MAKIKICAEKGCKDQESTEGFCRLHYLKHWKELRERKRKKAADKLNRYVEYMCKKHPDKHVDAIKKDLRSRDFEGRIGQGVGGDEADPGDILEEAGFEDEVVELISKLKIEKNFS